MPEFKQLAALVFASSLTLAGCAHAADETEEIEIIIKVDGEGLDGKALRAQIEVELKAGLAEALAGIEEAAEGLQEAKQELAEAELELAQLQMDKDEHEAARHEFEEARVELEQARAELERAKEEIHRSAREIKASLLGEDGEIEIEIETEVDGELVESHVNIGEPTLIVPVDDESND